MHEEARGRIFYAISYDKGGVLFTGEVGMGKTTVCNVIVRRLADNDIAVGIITNPTLELNDFLREILFQLGAKSVPDRKLDIVHKIRDRLVANHQKGKKTVLVIDEAHLITDPGMLEEIRLLLNYQADDRFLVTLVLVGQPELRKTIHNIPPLEQRLAIKFHMKRLSLEDTNKYIFYRLKRAGAGEPIFTKEAVRLVHRYTGGVPRKINQACDLSLLIGYSEKKYCVDANTVQKVIADASRHGYENG